MFYHSERVFISDAARRGAITGPLLPEVGLLTNLKVFKGNAFGITGNLPTEIGLTTSLGKSPCPKFLLDIAVCYVLTPYIASEFFQLEVSQALEGTIPTQLGNLSDLHTIRITAHTLSGPIPSELGKLTKMGK